MRIAQVAPLCEPVPPTYYGGTERVVSGLTEELVRRGHDVALFASGDSQTAAQLVPCCPRGLRLDSSVVDPMAHTVVQLDLLMRRAKEFDIIHNHVDFFAFPTARLLSTPMISTLHGRLDLPDLKPVYAHYPEVRLVSISNAQRAPFVTARWLATVYNGIDPARYTFRDRPGSYLAFLGRISPEKGIEAAVAIARAVDLPLRVAAKIDPVDRAYFTERVQPLFRDPRVEFLGEIDDAGKSDLLGAALAYLFPIDWPEPFGMTMVEAMACGTPVIAMNHGSVPEVVAHALTGFVCDSLREMIDAVAQVHRLSRRACRERAEQKFSISRMVDGYEAAYRAAVVAAESHSQLRRRTHGAAGNGTGVVAGVRHAAAGASNGGASLGVGAAGSDRLDGR